MSTKNDCKSEGDTAPATFTQLPVLNFGDIDGLDEQCKKLRQTVLAQVQKQEQLTQTVFFGGLAGTGKTQLMKATAGGLDEEFGYTHIESYPDDPDDVVPHIDEILTQAQGESPAVVLFEDFETVIRRGSTGVWNLFGELDNSRESVLVFLEIETDECPRPFGHHTQYPLWDAYIQLPADDENRNTSLFRNALGDIETQYNLTVEFNEIDFSALIGDLDWCRPADYEWIATRAADRAIATGSNQISQARLERTIEDLEDELENAPIHPFSSDSDGFRDERTQNDDSQFATPNTDVTFDDIGGLDDVTQRLEEVITYPQRYPDFFEETTLEQTSGVLLHGPPGNGKTLLARALANETDRTFLSVRGPELKNKWFGESERRIRELFEEAEEKAPSLIFFDEFDAVAPSRNACKSFPTVSVVNMLLTEMDGLEDRGDIVFLAATNRKEALDDAVLRPGRLGEKIEITPPDSAGQAEIFDIHTTGLPVEDNITGQWFTEIAGDDLSGADIEAICRRAAHAAIREADESPTIQRSHVERVLDTMTR